MALNAHQVTARKRLKSHDELMFIIPVPAVAIRFGIKTVER
jgi:hypothetical protein